MAELTKQQTVFANEYCIDRNGRQAAIRAGYSEKTADQQASRLLSNVKVKEYIDAKLNRISMKAEVTAEWVLNELKDTYKSAREQAELTAANKSLELMGKHIGMFTDKVKMDVQGEVSHEHEYYIEQVITADSDTAELLRQLYKRQTASSA